MLGRPNTLDTTSQVIDVPPAQLEELREGAQGVRWNFLHALLHAWSIIKRVTSSSKDRILGVGLVHQTVGPRRRQVARWEERRLLERQRQNRTWWQWLLIGLGVASLFVLLYLFVAYTYGFGVWIL